MTKEHDHHLRQSSPSSSSSSPSSSPSAGLTLRQCDIHHRHQKRLTIPRKGSLYAIIVPIILLPIVITYLALRPANPRFYLQNLHLTKINASSASNTPPTLKISLEATLSSHNPNGHIGICYSSLDTYVTYQDEPVTVPVALPPVYEANKDVAMWSPVLCESGVPVDPYVADAVAQDEAAGLLLLHVKVAGKVKWKVGSFTSGYYHLFVSCPVYVSPSNGNPIRGEGLSEIVECHVAV